MVYTNVFIKTYLIGYEKEGESCIFLLYSTKTVYKVHYSIVMDSYTENGRNKTLDVLKRELMKQKLDMLVWTHPHRDHYMGLTDIIKKYCNKYTKIVTPAIGNDLSMYDSEVQKIMSYINSLVHNRSIINKYNVEQISNVCKTFFDKELKDILLIKGIRFEIVSPFSALGYSNAGMKSLDLNKMSIGIVIQVYARDSAHYFLYTGDMDKDTISMLLYKMELGEIQIPSQYDYIKIPHHGSKASGGILNILSGNTKSDTAATTVFASQNLPDSVLLDKYKDKVLEVFRTDETKEGIVKKEYVLVE